MGRSIEKSKALFRVVKQGRGTLSHISHELTSSFRKKEGEKKELCGDLVSAYWVPHGRTGIYYPKGHEFVMEDVPKGAASFQQTYWLRSMEVVDHNQTTTDSSANGIFDHPFLHL